MEPDKISINLKDNPEIAAALVGVSPGTKVTLKEVEFTVDEATDQLLVGSIESIEGCECEPEAEDEAPADETSPVFVVMGKKK
jgi:small nuclear ribonucleoprotein (snRNP)-like protein